MDPSHPPFPQIERNGRSLYLSMFSYPPNWSTPPPDRRKWGLVLQLEAGDYTVCSGGTERRCTRVDLRPGAVERVDGRGSAS